MDDVQLVVARYNEDVEWIPDGLNVIVYNKGSPLMCKHRVVTIENMGREAGTILHHIVANYDNLAETTIFCQGDSIAHSPNFIKLLERVHMFSDVQALSEKVETPGFLWPHQEILDNHKDHWLDGCRIQVHKASAYHLQTIVFDDPNFRKTYGPYVEEYKLLPGTNILQDVIKRHNFTVKPSKDIIEFCVGGIFAVRKANILQHSREAYASLLKECNRLWIMPYVLERLWLELFAL